MDSSLNAAFALLNDARAQNFALQRRLRNSLSVRWTDDALVMQRSSKRELGSDATRARVRESANRSSGGDAMGTARGFTDTITATRRHDERSVGQPAATLDSLDDPLDCSHQRLRTKIEWDVAKRIARIDRELANLPPAQRFWNKRRSRDTPLSLKQERPDELFARTNRARRVLTEAQTRPNDAPSQRALAREHSASQAQTVRQEARRQSSRSVVQPLKSSSSEQSAVAQTKPLTTQTTTDKDTTGLEANSAAGRTQQMSSLNNKSMAGLRRSKSSEREKENRPPSQQTLRRESSLFRVADERAMSLAPSLSAAQERHDSSTSVESVSTSALVNAISSTSINGQEPQQDSSKPTDRSQDVSITDSSAVTSTAETLTRAIALTLCDDDDNNIDDSNEQDADLDTQARQQTRLGSNDSRQHQQQQLQQRLPLASSVGRQVLSEFRTAPSMALYGPLAVAGNTRERKLNSDVLRRLFSDLDSDRDGHLNRIETCIALHRLQVAVPAPQIASFFRRVHADVAIASSDPKRKGNTSRDAVHQPLREVISYKQFIAFVTAAYEQHTQKARPVEPRATSAPQSVPRSTARLQHQPAATQPSTRIPPMHFSASIAVPSERALYELDATHESDDDRLEKSVLQRIPEYLMAQVLADEQDIASTGAQTPARTKMKPDAASLVRRSLEKLLPHDSIDEQLVRTIARDLIHEHLRSPQEQVSNDSTGDEDDDRSGLRRAAAYFEMSRSMDAAGEGDSTFAISGEHELEDVENWLSVLSEEQAAALVNEILKERAAVSLPNTPDVMDNDAIDDFTPEEPALSPLAPVPAHDKAVEPCAVDKETDTCDLLSSHITLVAEKEAQASAADASDADESEKQPSAAATQVSSVERSTDSDARELVPAMRTNLATAVALATSDEPSHAHVVTAQIPRMRTTVLQQLRAQRKRQQASILSSSTKCEHQSRDCPKDVSFQSVPMGHQMEEQHISRIAATATPADVDTFASVSSDSSDSRWTLDDPPQPEARAVAARTADDPPPAPTELVAKTLFADDKFAGDRSASDLSPNSSASHSARSSLESFGAVSARHRMRASPSYTRADRRQYNSVDASVSSYRSSLASEDLSDGEMAARSSMDMSDGELYGQSRKRVMQQKNATSQFFGAAALRRRGSSSSSGGGDEADLKSSIESGELLPIRQLRSAYQQRVLAWSCSSVESGELEDGRVLDN